MWSNVDKIILRIEPWIHFYSKTTYLYASQYCSKEYEYCLLQYSRFVKELVQTKKKIRIPYGCKSHCKSINEHWSNLESCIHSRQKNKIKIFPPVGNEFLPSSKNITLKDYHIMYPMKQRDLCDYDPSAIWSCRTVITEGYF